MGQDYLIEEFAMLSSAAFQWDRLSDEDKAELDALTRYWLNSNQTSNIISEDFKLGTLSKVQLNGECFLAFIHFEGDPILADLGKSPIDGIYI
jgi:hypothetical protein